MVGRYRNTTSSRTHPPTVASCSPARAMEASGPRTGKTWGYSLTRSPLVPPFPGARTEYVTNHVHVVVTGRGAKGKDAQGRFACDIPVPSEVS